MSLANLSLDSNRALTFQIGDTRFGIDVCNILAFSDEYTDIRSPSRDVPGFTGFLDYRQRLVKVFECATVLNRGRARECMERTTREIQTFSRCHAQWLSAIEQSLNHPERSGLRTYDDGLAFERWLADFNSDDEGLNALIARLTEPHTAFNQLTDRVRVLAEQQRTGDAREILKSDGHALLRKIDRLFNLIQDYLRSNVHPVILHLTRDGLSPWFSLVLDEIDDIVEYDPDWIDTTSADALGNEPVSGYIRHKQGENFMMLAIDELHTRLSQLSEACD